MSDDVKIDMINADLPNKCLNIVKDVYNHPNTNSFTKDYIRFELQKLFGRDVDVKGWLDGDEEL